MMSDELKAKTQLIIKPKRGQRNRASLFLQ